MIYDGTDLGALMHAECARPLMASPRVSKSTSAGRDGFEVSSVRLESFDVDVECYVLPGWPLDMAEGIREASDAKRLIASALYRKGKRRLIFDDDPAVYGMAIVSGVSDVTRVGYVDYFTVTFTCDPLFLSAEERSQDLPHGKSVVRVGGTAPADARFEIRSSSTSVKVTGPDGSFVKVPCSNGSMVRVDMESKRATVNGADARVSIESTFFEIGPGDSEVHVDGGSGVVRWREAWL